MRRLIEVLAVGVTDDSGLPVENGTVTFYDAGTSNLRTVYQDFAETSTLAHANPATLDAAGRLIAYSSYRVKLVIRTSAGATVRTIDNVGTADSDLSSASASTFAGSGLTAPGDGSLAVNVDGTTLEINSDTIRVKDGGISAAKLGANAVTEAKANFVMGADELDNCIVSCSVASSALTIALKTKAAADASATDPITIGFRSATLTSGAYSYGSVVAALSTVISSGSTAGHTSATEHPLYVYALLTGSTVELAWSSSPKDERYLQTTVAEGGAGAADSIASLYSTTQRTSVPVRLLAVLKSTQTTAGTWAAVPTAISSPGRGALEQIPYRYSAATVGVGGVAVSASSGAEQTTTSTSNQDITSLSVTITTSGRPVFVGLMPDSTIQSYIGCRASASTGAGANFYLIRDSTAIAAARVEIDQASASSGWELLIPPSSLYRIDAPSAGTYTYKAQFNISTGAGTAVIQKAVLVAYEL